MPNQPTPPIVPHLIVPRAFEAIEFYKRAFGAQVEGEVMKTPDQRVMHAMLRFPNGGVVFLMSPREPEAERAAPSAEVKVIVHLELPDVDATWRTATVAGAKIALPLADQFWGARYGMLEDGFGQRWSLATTRAR